MNSHPTYQRAASLKQLRCQTSIRGEMALEKSASFKAPSDGSLKPRYEKSSSFKLFSNKKTKKEDQVRRRSESANDLDHISEHRVFTMDRPIYRKSFSFKVFHSKPKKPNFVKSSSFKLPRQIHDKSQFERSTSSTSLSSNFLKIENSTPNVSSQPEAQSRYQTEQKRPSYEKSSSTRRLHPRSFSFKKMWWSRRKLTFDEDEDEDANFDEDAVVDYYDRQSKRSLNHLIVIPDSSSDDDSDCILDEIHEITLLEFDSDGYLNTLIVKNLPKVSPQVRLHTLLQSRGYLVSKKYAALQCGYYCEPTALQLASHGSYLMEIVQDRNTFALKEFLSSGMSYNPCDEYGDSLIHMLCRLGDEELLHIVLDSYDFVERDGNKSKGTYFSPVQVSNFMGRTPLHEACSSLTPNFEVVKMLLDRDPNLIFVTDCHDILPFECICTNLWTKWNSFIEKNARFISDCWPKRKAKTGPQPSPWLALMSDDSCSFPSPKAPLLPELAAKVACGEMRPSEAKYIMRTNNRNRMAILGSGSDRGASLRSADESSSVIEEEDMADFLHRYFQESNECLGDEDLEDLVHEISHNVPGKIRSPTITKVKST